MMKLELKYLSAYLPYNLKIRVFRYDHYLFIEDLVLNGEILDYIMIPSDINEYKPILRPLSDLTKEIEIDGEKFVPSLIICKEYCHDVEWGNNTIGTGIMKDGNMINVCFIHNKILGECNLMIYEKLLEWHFDIFGLIEKRLAIDINTIKN